MWQMSVDTRKWRAIRQKEMKRSATVQPAHMDANLDLSAANLGAAVAQLLGLISCARDELERCAGELERVSAMVAQVRRMEPISNGARFQEALNANGADAASGPSDAPSKAPNLGTWSKDLSALDAVDTAGVAALLGISREYATDHIVKMPGFPAPVVNLSQKLRAWDRDEVLAFIKKRTRRRR
jgi:predicted DNA-binding transcriptional regulator AlpA